MKNPTKRPAHHCSTRNQEIARFANYIKKIPCAAGVSLLAVHPASAEIILDEPFNYTLGEINRNPLPSATGLVGGGVGFTGPWTGGGNVVDPGQNHPTISSSGSGFSSADQAPAYRSFRNPINVNPASPTTVFVRYITSAASAIPPDYAGFSFFSGPNGAGRTEELFLGKPWMAPNYGMEVSGFGNPQASEIPVNEAETLLVFRISFTSGADTIDMFVNPGTTLPEAPDFQRIAPAGAFQNFTHIRLASGNNGQSFDVDQVRVSTTYAEAISTVDLNADSDLDGMPDAWEALYPNPDGLTVGINDAGLNPDGDTLTNIQEYERSTNPKKADTDDDGLSDDRESNSGFYSSPQDTGTNPNVADTDNDGLLDGVENNSGTYESPGIAGTDPFNADTDFDGVPDGLEVTLGTDPNSGTSVPPSGDLVLIGTDDFDSYADGIVANLDGGFGFDYDSRTDNGFFIGHTSRVSAWQDRNGAGASVVGGALKTDNNGAVRNFHGVDPFFGNEEAGRIGGGGDAQVVYLRADLTRDDFSLTSLFSPAFSGNALFTAGVLQDSNFNYVFGIGGQNITELYTETQPVPGQTYKIILKVDYIQGTFSLWVDPNLSAAESTPNLTSPMPTDQLVLPSNSLRLFSSATSTWDNVVVSREWAALAGGTITENNYASWIAGFPVVGVLTGFNDDPDGDGLANGVENLFGGDPTQFTQGLVQVATAGNQVTFRHNKGNTVRRQLQLPPDDN